MYDISHDTLRYYDKIGLLKPNVKKIMDIVSHKENWIIRNIYKNYKDNSRKN